MVNSWLWAGHLDFEGLLTGVEVFVCCPVFPGEITMRRRPEWILNGCRWILHGPDRRVWAMASAALSSRPSDGDAPFNPDHRHRKGAFVHSRPAPPALPSRPRCSEVMLLLLAGRLS